MKNTVPIEIIYRNEAVKEAMRQYTDGSAGTDLIACLKGNSNALIIDPHTTEVVECGFKMFINDPNYVAKLYSRSGLSIKRAVGLANSVGVLDSDYQGEVMVALHNISNEAVEVYDGERVAQMLIEPVYHPLWNEVSEFSKSTVRGAGGFGSTGGASNG